MHHALGCRDAIISFFCWRVNMLAPTEYEIKWRKDVHSLNYQIIVNELKGRLARMTDAPDAHRQRIAEQTRQRFIYFLDEDHTLSLEEVISQLERKWRADGLLDD